VPDRTLFSSSVISWESSVGRRSGRVILVHKGDVDIPTDLSGVVYIPVAQSIIVRRTSGLGVSWPIPSPAGPNASRFAPVQRVQTSRRFGHGCSGTTHLGKAVPWLRGCTPVPSAIGEL
jgi:hypothetical protein